jgi:uncharacterized protein
MSMQVPRDAILLRIFFGEDDRYEHRPLHEAIVLFGHSSQIHTSQALRLSQDLPIIVEIVDAQSKIDAFLPVLDSMMSSGLVTIEKVQVLQYGTGTIAAT